MNGCLFICRSSTFAQRMKNALLRGGVEARIVRPNLKLTNGACGYAVRVSEVFMAEALAILKEKRLEPERVLLADSDGRFREWRA